MHDKNTQEKDDAEKKASATVPSVVASMSNDQRRSLINWLQDFALSNPRQLKRLNNSYSLLCSCYPDLDQRVSTIHFNSEKLKDINIFPMMLVLIVIEYLNALESPDVRDHFKSQLVNIGTLGETLGDKENREVTLAASLITGDFSRVFKELIQESRIDLIKIVELFVLPAIE